MANPPASHSHSRDDRLRSARPSTAERSRSGHDPAAFSWLAKALATRWQEAVEVESPPDSADTFWEAVKQLAMAERVAGLLCRQVLQRRVRVPRAVLFWLTTLNVRVAHRAAPERAAVCEIVQALTESRIPFLVLQGWGLLALIYDNDLEQRPNDDLDLFVPVSVQAKALAVLEGLGYRKTIAEPWPGFNLRYDGAMHMHRLATAGTTLGLDFHWQFMAVPWYWPRLGADWFGRARRLDMGDGTSLPVASPTDFLLYLCLHQGINHHDAVSLFRYHDLALLIGQAGNAIDWDSFVQQARQAKAVLPVLSTLKRLQGIWPGTIPSAVMDDLGRPVGRQERWLYSWQVQHTHDAWSGVMLKLATLPGLKSRFGYVLGSAFPSPAYMRQRYRPTAEGPWYAGYIHRASIAFGQLRGHATRAKHEES